MGRLKNFTLQTVNDTDRMAVVNAYHATRTWTGTVAPCRRCRQRTSRPTALCHICSHSCQHDVTLTGYIIVRNGAAQPKSFCLECGGIWGVQRGGTILDVLLEDRTADTNKRRPQPCRRCGATTGSELHHWAPRAIFEDADWWPQDYLCVTCHRTWHQAMRSAGGYRLPDDERRHIPDWNPRNDVAPWMSA